MKCTQIKELWLQSVSLQCICSRQPCGLGSIQRFRSRDTDKRKKTVEGHMRTKAHIVQSCALFDLKIPIQCLNSVLNSSVYMFEMRHTLLKIRVSKKGLSQRCHGRTIYNLFMKNHLWTIYIPFIYSWFEKHLKNLKNPFPI